MFDKTWYEIKVKTDTSIFSGKNLGHSIITKQCSKKEGFSTASRF